MEATLNISEKLTFTLEGEEVDAFRKIMKAYFQEKLLSLEPLGDVYLDLNEVLGVHE